MTGVQRICAGCGSIAESLHCDRESGGVCQACLIRRHPDSVGIEQSDYGNTIGVLFRWSHGEDAIRAQVHLSRTQAQRLAVEITELISDSEQRS